MDSIYRIACAISWPRSVLVAISVLLAAALVAAPLDAHGEEVSPPLVVPSAPPDGDLSFDIPVPAWLGDRTIALKQEFVDGVSAEAVRIAADVSMVEATSVIEATRQLSTEANRVSSAMSALGALDPTCGIPGLSPLMPMQGAVRETLFGHIVWHESVTGKSRPLTADLQRVVGVLQNIGNSSLRMGRDIDLGMDPIQAGGGRTDFAAIAANATRLTEAMAGLTHVAAEAETAAVELEQIVWEVRDGAGVRDQPRLDSEWETVQMAASEVRRLAAKIEPALSMLSSSNQIFIRLVHSVESMSENLSTLRALPRDEDGSIYMPWHLMRADAGILEELELKVLEPGAGVYPDETLAAIRTSMQGVVEADRMLASRAVEFASTRVALAEDRFDLFYMMQAGYDLTSADRQGESVLIDVAGRLIRNADLQSAHTSATASRAWLAEGMNRQAEGAGAERGAITAYKNAWVHALNAGASAERALSRAKLN